jgi:hypothetical protein
MTHLRQLIRGFWLALTGAPPAARPATNEVIVHDPGADRPHDLDDPFFDSKVQSRMAGVIANNATKRS